MSIQTPDSAHEAACRDCDDTGPVARVMSGKTKSIGAFSVSRVLPSMRQRLVGPFIFFDHMGPAELPPGAGIEVRPHPHIGLATVTYLFEGEIDHRDSLGYHQAIQPGAINWMTAGRGIVHSERSAPQQLDAHTRLDGIQLWLALPKAHEETEPSFVHHPADTIPAVTDAGTRLRVLAGRAYGVESPVKILHPLYYVDAVMQAGGAMIAPDHLEERAVYVASGRVRIGGETIDARQMAILKPGQSAEIICEADARVMHIGGAPLEEPRHIWWNFVSSSRDRIEAAKADWKAGRFPKVPGDEDEFIPLPEG